MADLFAPVTLLRLLVLVMDMLSCYTMWYHLKSKSNFNFFKGEGVFWSELWSTQI